MMEEEDIGYEQIKQEARDKHSRTSAIELVRRMHEIQQEKEKLDAALTRINAYFDVIRLELLPDAMQNEGIKSPFNVEGVGRITLTGDAYVSLDKSKRDELFWWLQKNNLADIIQQTINSSTLKAFAKSRLKKGLELPDAIKVTPFTRASITRS